MQMPPAFLLSAALFASSVLPAFSKDEMKANQDQSGTPGQQCRIDAGKSACGLPSQAVIDLASTRVKHTEAEWRRLLTAEVFRVTREQGTEPPFQNAYWNFHDDGVYFSACSDTPLFDSRDKFDSGTGWPSFTKPIEPKFVVESRDSSHGMLRTEVHCGVDGAHLGHVFSDGPAPTGLRYCINSASLRFMPRREYEAWLAKQSAAEK